MARFFTPAAAAPGSIWDVQTVPIGQPPAAAKPAPAVVWYLRLPVGRHRMHRQEGEMAVLRNHITFLIHRGEDKLFDGEGKNLLRREADILASVECQYIFAAMQSDFDRCGHLPHAVCPRYGDDHRVTV